MAENKKISELDSIQNLSDNDEFVVIDKSVAFGEDASSTGKTSKVSLAQLKQAVLASGQKGSQGTQGDEGPKGPDGEAGIKGKVGEPGEKGKPGETGPAGSEGGSGERGPKGFIGDDGFEGDPGLPGPSGDKGNSGRKGSPGPKGEKGNRGYKGFPGPQGDPGEVGPVADRGPRGVKGVKGVKGTKGIQGSRGQKGPKGREVGKPGDRGRKPENGLPGDPGESLGSGEKGPRGEMGRKGARGRKGFKGDKGQSGAIGLPPGGYSRNRSEKIWNVRKPETKTSPFTTKVYETTDPLFPLTGYYETPNKSIELKTDPHGIYKTYGKRFTDDEAKVHNRPKDSLYFPMGIMQSNTDDRNAEIHHNARSMWRATNRDLEGVFIWPQPSGWRARQDESWQSWWTENYSDSPRSWPHSSYVSSGFIRPYTVTNGKNYTPETKYLKKIHSMNTGVKHSQALFYYELYFFYGSTLDYRTVFRESAHIRTRRNYARIAGFTFNKLNALRENKTLTEEEVDFRVRYYTPSYTKYEKIAKRNVKCKKKQTLLGLHYDWTSDMLLGTGYDLDRNFLYCLPATDYKFHMHDSLKNWYFKPNVDFSKIRRGGENQPSLRWRPNNPWVFQRQNRSYAKNQNNTHEDTFDVARKTRFQLDYSTFNGLNHPESWRMIELYIRSNKPRHLTNTYVAEQPSGLNWVDTPESEQRFPFTYRHETRLQNSDESYGPRRAVVYPTHLGRKHSATENRVAKWGFFSAELTNAEIWVCTHNSSRYKHGFEYFTMERAAAETGDGKHIYDETGSLSKRVQGFNTNRRISSSGGMHADFKWHRVASNAPLVRTEPVPVHLQKLLPDATNDAYKQKHQTTMEGEQITLVDGPDPFAKEKKVFPFIAPVRNGQYQEGCYIHAHHESYGVPHDFKNEHYDPSAHREDAYKQISKLDPIKYKDGIENTQSDDLFGRIFPKEGETLNHNSTFHRGTWLRKNTNNYGGYFHKDETNNTDIKIIKNSAPWSIFDGDLRGSPCASNIENAWGNHKLQLIGTY